MNIAQILLCNRNTINALMPVFAYIFLMTQYFRTFVAANIVITFKDIAI